METGSDEGRRRLDAAQTRWNQARAAWLDDDGSDVVEEATNRWEWARAQRELREVKAALAAALAPDADEG